jgi:putative oxidoreductase
MAQQMTTEHVGRSGIYPASGPAAPADAVVRGQGELAHPEERRPRTARSRWPGNAPLLELGRALFGGYFLYNGMNHFRNAKMLAEYARSKQIPLPEVAVVGSGALITLGGLSLIAGVRPKIGASLITAFLLGVTPAMHNFWEEKDETQRMNDFVNFMKNLALLGGACLAAALPEPWPLSVPLPSGASGDRVNDGPVAQTEQLTRYGDPGAFR